MLEMHGGYEGNILIDYFVETMREFPKRGALTCLTTGRAFTYGELDRITNQLDHRFRDAGLKKDDVVMACLLNTWQFPMLMLGAWKTPCIFSPINFRLAPGEIAVHLDDSKPKVFVWDSVFDKTIGEALKLAKYKPPILLSTGKPVVEGAVFFEDYYKDAPEEDPDVEERVRETLDPFQDEILRHYTSGTTGLPKGTRQTSLVTMHMDWTVLIAMGINWNDKMTNITPWFHQGAIHFLTTGLNMGAHVFGVPLAPFNPDYLLDIVEKHKITVICGAPPVYDALAAIQRKKPRDLSSLRWIHTVGAPFSREEYREWQENLCKNIGNTYGTTETRADSVLSSFWHPMEEKAGTIGRRAPFVKMRVIQIRPGEKVEPDEMVPKDGKTQGEIISKSPSQFIGYFNRPEDTAKHLHKGWFYSGDIGTWDEDGFITVTGRVDDMIQSGAEKVYPIPVEECLMRYSKVKDAFVVPLPHEKWGQAVAAYVVPREGEELTVEELDKHCLGDPYLANYTRPRYYRIFKEELPYTATGKKMHYVMANRAKEEVEKFIPIPSERGE